ncbi:hypothetical protein GCM10028818_32980 [Spirosoma horti]
MKPVFLLTLFFGLITAKASFSQVYVDGVLIDTLNTPYCQLIGSNASLLSKAHIVIDYGQRYLNSGLNRQQISGPNRQPMVFNSTIDALNFMVRQGWELISTQVIGNESGSESTFIYMLKRRKLPLEPN